MTFQKGMTPWNKGIKSSIKPWLGKKRTKRTKLKVSEGLKRHFSKPENKRSREKAPAWKGGRSINSGGYITILLDGRHRLEHRYLMAKHLGRKLKLYEIVHHTNHNKLDNRIENLQLTTHPKHTSHHRNFKP